MDGLDKQSRAERARQLQDDPLLQEALDSVEQAAIEALASCDIGNLAALQRYTASLKAARDVRQHLMSVIQTGEIVVRRGPMVA